MQQLAFTRGLCYKLYVKVKRFSFMSNDDKSKRLFLGG